MRLEFGGCKKEKKNKERKIKKNEHKGEISHITISHDDHVRTSVIRAENTKMGRHRAACPPYQILHKSVTICTLQYKQAFASTVPEKFLGIRHKRIHYMKDHTLTLRRLMSYIYIYMTLVA